MRLREMTSLQDDEIDGYAKVARAMPASRRAASTCADTLRHRFSRHSHYRHLRFSRATTPDYTHLLFTSFHLPDTSLFDAYHHSSAVIRPIPRHTIESDRRHDMPRPSSGRFPLSPSGDDAPTRAANGVMLACRGAARDGHADSGARREKRRGEIYSAL